MATKFISSVYACILLLIANQTFSQKGVIRYDEVRQGSVGLNPYNYQQPLKQYTHDGLLDLPAAQNSESFLSKLTAAPPANDECATAIAITIGGGDVSYSNVGATAAASDPAVASWPSCTGGGANNIKHTVWFKFTVTGGPLNITVSSQGETLNGNAAIDKALYSVFSGFCGSLTQIGTTRAGTYGNFNSKSINLANLANGTYFIMTDGLCSQTGTYRIRVNITPPGAPTLWYEAGPIPSLATGASLTSGGQWGTYAATTELSANCGAAGLGFSDWYKFVYDPATQDHLGITDHALQSGFYIGLYSSAGAQLICNKYGTADFPSFSWDLSAQEGIPMHMPNISLRELGLTAGATYFVRVANTSTGAENVNTGVGGTYTIRLGNFVPPADSYLNNTTLTLTQANTFSWLNGQTNRFAGHSMLTEPEKGNLAIAIDNSLMYKFNTATVTAVDVALRNLTYYNHGSSSALGQIAVFTSPQGGTSVGSNLAFSGATFTLSLTGLTTATDYWIMVDGGGSFGGTRLTFDISVSIPFGALPIELVSFEGISEAYRNLLSWSTATEKNNDYFTVEKSSNGLNFYDIGKVKAIVNSSRKADYTFSDNETISGTSYYRLKQTDFDGSSATSKIISINTESKKSLNALVVPNPSGSGNVSLNFTSESEGKANLKIYSISGQLIKSFEIQSLKGKNTFDVNVEELSKGMYFFNFLLEDQLQNIKFIKD